MNQQVAGWYPDPYSPSHVRWWDGYQWTLHVEPIPTLAPQSLVPRFHPPPQPRRSRSRRPWIIAAIAVGAAAVLVIAAVWGIAAFGNASVDHTAIVASPIVPAGFVTFGDYSTAVATTSSLYGDQKHAIEKLGISSPQCSALLYHAPMQDADSASRDRVQILGQYVLAGSSGQDLRVSAIAREYATPEAAQEVVAAMGRLQEACAGGFTGTGITVTAVTGLSSNFNGDESEGWVNEYQASGRAVSEETVNQVNGRVVVRVSWQILAGSQPAYAGCASWMTNVDTVVMHPSTN